MLHEPRSIVRSTHVSDVRHDAGVRLGVRTTEVRTYGFRYVGNTFDLLFTVDLFDLCSPSSGAILR